MASTAAAYTVRPLQLGVEVLGINLMDHLGPSLIDRIKSDTLKYGLMVFRDQHTLTPDRHVHISQWFGDIDYESYYKHPKSPSDLIFRVSNDKSEGCTNVGRTGWHIDGTFRRCPYAVSVYHMMHVPRTGDTRFCAMADIWAGLSAEEQAEWDRLWMVADRRDNVIHPLVYTHPQTRKKTLCFHLGMTQSFVRDYGQPSEQQLGETETIRMLERIHNAVTRDNERLIYSHHWQPGDFIISDNLAVAHEAAATSQLPRADVGLRVLHRCTVKGTAPPQK